MDKFPWVSDLPMSFTLKSGAEVQLIQSRKSAVPQGVHLILSFVEDGKGDDSQSPREFTPDEFTEMMFLIRRFAEFHAVMNEDGESLYQISVNSAGMSRRKHLHIHLIMPASKSDLPRLVDPTIAFNELPDFVKAAVEFALREQGRIP
jgi:hypothetical protein